MYITTINNNNNNIDTLDLSKQEHDKQVSKMFLFSYPDGYTSFV